MKEILSSTFTFSSSGGMASHVTSKRIFSDVQRKSNAFVFYSVNCFYFSQQECV